MEALILGGRKERFMQTNCNPRQLFQIFTAVNLVLWWIHHRLTLTKACEGNLSSDGITL